MTTPTGCFDLHHHISVNFAKHNLAKKLARPACLAKLQPDNNNVGYRHWLQAIYEKEQHTH